MLNREQSDALLIAELQQKNADLTAENLRLTSHVAVEVMMAEMEQTRLKMNNASLAQENLRLTNELSEVNDLCQSVIHDAKVKEEIHSRE